MSNNDVRREIALLEWDKVQNNANVVAGHIFLIRGWSITVFSGMVALVINNSDRNIVALALIPTILFYLLERLYSGFLSSWKERSYKIEKWLSSDMVDDFKSPMMEDQFATGNYSTVKAFEGLWRRPSAWFLFISMIITNIAVYLYL